MTKSAAELRRPIRRYFEGEQFSWAVQALQAYCDGRTGQGRWLYTGGWFDRLAGQSEPDAFTAQDIVAISMLSVTVPAHAAIELLETERDDFSKLLERVDKTRHIWEVEEAVLGPGSHADDLWHRLRKLDGVGAVIAGKLLAAKRPRLIPVFDQHVHAALAPPPGEFWMAMRLSMEDAHQIVTAAVSEAGVGLTPLRAVDVVVWMHQHGWTSAGESLRPPPTFD